MPRRSESGVFVLDEPRDPNLRALLRLRVGARIDTGDAHPPVKGVEVGRREPR